MIINAQRNFGFVHIPKNAGSTIRHQLRHLDDANGKFYRNIMHPLVGKVSGNHLTLALLRSGFPEDFKALSAVTSYSILREPIDRFISGVAQSIRQDNQEAADFSQKEIVEKARNVMRHLEGSTSGPDLKHTIFTRQVDYIELDGVRFIDRTFCMEDLTKLFDALERDHNLRLIRDKVWNPTVTYRKPEIAKTLNKAKDVAKRYLPLKAYASLRDIGIRAFTSKGVPKLNEAVLGADDVRAFIQEYYIEDARLYEAAKGSIDKSVSR